MARAGAPGPDDRLRAAGITQVVIPVATIVEVLIAVFIFAILAALFPAHRASKLDVLKAITSV